MARRIVVMDSALSAAGIARELVPTGFELVVAAPGSPEFAAATAGAEFLVGFGEPLVNDAFYQVAPGVKLYQLLSSALAIHAAWQRA